MYTEERESLVRNLPRPPVANDNFYPWWVGTVPFQALPLLYVHVYIQMQNISACVDKDLVL